MRRDSEELLEELGEVLSDKRRRAQNVYAANGIEEERLLLGMMFF